MTSLGFCSMADRVHFFCLMIAVEVLTRAACGSSKDICSLFVTVHLIVPWSVRLHELGLFGGSSRHLLGSTFGPLKTGAFQMSWYEYSALQESSS
ncbi:hypothetical protein BC832DRAFT_411185 [Gaertneriomyces semiglobifer]|nr:hypothetical protein BC832DRAFT_411185 [Gaertneriomyces semiglobifer]